MKASVLDLRRRMPEILRALDQNETVTLLYRGKKKAVISPAVSARAANEMMKHPAFGMWRDRRDLRDVRRAVRALRKARYGAI